MGIDILKRVNTKVTKYQKLAFLSTFIIGLLIHAYKFTNNLMTHDSYLNFYSSQNMVGSGRWFLTFACGISSYFDLPWVNGLLSLVFISITAVVIVDLFSIKNPVLIAIIGGLIVSAPPITTTFYYEYTADGYMLAMLLAALTVRLSTFEKNNLKWSVLSSVCLCLSCGIYQAYVSFAMLLAIFYFIMELFSGKRSNKECWKYILRQIVIYISAMISYYIIWKICLKIQNTTPYDYRGISDVAQLSGLSFSFSNIIHQIRSSILGLFNHFFGAILKYGISLYAVLNFLFFAFLGIGFILSVIKTKLYSRIQQLIMGIVAVILIIPCAFIWHFVSSEVTYYELMLQSLTLIFIFAAIMYENCLSSMTIKNIFALLLSAIIFNNGILANIAYDYMDKSYERSYSTSSEMAARIHSFSDGTEFDSIEVISIPWDASVGIENKDAGIALMLSYLDEDFLFESLTIGAALKTYHQIEYPISEYDGEYNAQIDEMGVWPLNSSMKVIDNTLIIKMYDKNNTED